MEDTHGDFLDIIDSVEKFQCTECVEHHLGIVFRLYEYAHTVFEVNNVEPVSTDDDAVCRSERLRYITCEVKTLLDKHHRRRNFSHLFLNERNIVIGTAIHLIIFKIRVRALAAELQKFTQLMLTERVRCCSFGGYFTR